MVQMHIHVHFHEGDVFQESREIVGLLGSPWRSWTLGALGGSCWFLAGSLGSAVCVEEAPWEAFSPVVLGKSPRAFVEI